MDTRQKQQLIQEINEYLALMPNAIHYNICRQQETKRMLTHVLNLAGRDEDLFNRKLLSTYLDRIAIWDGVTSEPEDMAFQLLIMDVQAELRELRARLQMQGSPGQVSNYSDIGGAADRAL